MNLKKLFFFVFTIFLLISSVFAVEWDYARHDGNCNKWNIEYYNSLLEDGSIFKNKKIITKDVFEVAIWNLEKYCNNEWNWLQSPIFANQILDIAFRKVDGIEWLAYWVKLDPVWKKYRDQLNEIQKEYDTDPQKISKLFESSWWSAEQNIDANDSSIYWRYQLICKEFDSMADKLLAFKSQNNKVSPMSNAYLREACNKIVENKYQQETTLISKISLQNFYHHAEKKLYKQVNEEFTKKIWKLFDDITIMLWDLEYVARRFIHATDVQTR